MTTSTFSLPHWFNSAYVAGMQRGIEKEGLRMQPDGYSAKTFHPAKLGSKLTHPYITTDYAENLLELITAPKPTIKEALDMLRDLHVLVHRSLENDELMWPLSMPCMTSDTDSDIPLADYGTSNVGRLKTLYRSGLGVRYGRKMQTIAGLHYNLSVGDDLFGAWAADSGADDLTAFKNDKYLALIRNFKRLTPLVLYLLGASPAVCGTFISGRAHSLIPLGGSCSYYQPNGTSLRMGKLGYTNSVQEDLDIRYNDLAEYIKGLRAAIGTPFADFEKIGVDDEHGNPIQINSHVLQIENEYYSPIRPKQVTKAGETPTAALAARGIAYVEFRAIDLDPYADIGITTTTACFLEVLALYCLLSDSPTLLPAEDKVLADNIDIVVNHGRKDGISITDTDGSTVNLHDWIVSHLSQMQVIADAFDAHHGGNDYRSALAMMQGKATDATFTLSAQIEEDSRRLGSIWTLGKTLAQKHHAELLSHALSHDDEAHFEAISRDSVAEQQAIEAADSTDFYSYIQAYR